jgi:hypothetical protein
MKKVMMESFAPDEQPIATGPIYEETGIPACNDYLRATDRYATCDDVPQAARNSLVRSAQQMKNGWASLRDKSVPPEAVKAAADGCQQAFDAIKTAAAATGCPL